MIPNIFTNTVKSLIDICIGIPKYRTSFFSKECVSLQIPLVMFLLIMLRAIQFNHNFMGCNIEINNVISQHFLTMHSNRQLL